MLGLMSADVQTAQDRKVDFGVNGHPLYPGTYYDVSLEKQISLLKSLRLKTYRVNVNPDNVTLANPDKFDRLSQLITLAQREGIRILPVINLPPKNYSDENAACRLITQATATCTRIKVAGPATIVLIRIVISPKTGPAVKVLGPRRWAITTILIT
jgi:hypothetical protein